MFERAEGLYKSECNHPEKRKERREKADVQQWPLYRITDKRKNTQKAHTFVFCDSGSRQFCMVKYILWLKITLLLRLTKKPVQRVRIGVSLSAGSAFTCVALESRSTILSLISLISGVML